MKRYTLVNIRCPAIKPGQHIAEILGCGREIPFNNEVATSRFHVYLLDSTEWHNPNRCSGDEYCILVGDRGPILDEGRVVSHKRLINRPSRDLEYMKIEGHKAGLLLMWCSTEDVILNPSLPPVGKYSGQIRQSMENVMNEIIARRQQR